MITLLQAVNSILRNLGTSAVTNIEVVNPDVQAALHMLDEKRIAIQSQGWWFNTQTGVVLPLTLTGECIVPPNTIKVDTKPDGIDAVQHGTKLFNRDDNSFIFPEPVELGALVLAIDWDNLPFTVKETIKFAAMHQIQSDLEGDVQKMQQIEGQLNGAFLSMKREHVQNRDVNAFNSKRAARLLGRRRGFGTRSGDFLGGIG